MSRASEEFIEPANVEVDWKKITKTGYATEFALRSEGPEVLSINTLTAQ